MKRNIINEIKNIFILIISNMVLGFLVAAFVIPHNIIMGGATGIGIVLSHYIQLDTATIVFIFNLLMLILGGIILGKKFLITSVASSFLYPFFLSLAQRIPGIENLTNNSLMATIFAGGLLGLAIGMIMRIGSSSGGTDVLNLILNKLFDIPISIAVYICDFIILIGQALFSDPEHILYGILLIVIETLVIDKIMITEKSQFQLFIISEKYEEIRWHLLTELEVGATMVYIETGVTCKDQKGILCVFPKHKYHAARQLIHSLDSNAFMTISQINEVSGQGFTQQRIPFYSCTLK